MLPGRGAGRRDPLQPSPGEPAAGLRVARPRLARSPPARFLTAGTRRAERAGEPRGLGPLDRRTASLDFFFLGGILAVQSETVEMHNLQSKSFFFFLHLCTSLHRALYLQAGLSSLAGRAGVCERWECVCLGECCLERADGRLGGDTPVCPPGGDTAEKRWGLGLEFRKY